MKLTALVFMTVFTVIQVSAQTAPIQKDFEINEPKFASRIYKAYAAEAKKVSPGVIQFSDLLKCSKTKCVLLAGKWLTNAGLLNEKYFTPAEEGDTFDMSEYMRIKPKVTHVDGYEMRTKKIQVESNGLSYMLTCVHAADQSAENLLVQCTLLNGVEN